MNEKGANGEHLWSEKRAWQYNRSKEKKQRLVRCGHFDDVDCIVLELLTVNNFFCTTATVCC